MEQTFEIVLGGVTVKMTSRFLVREVNDNWGVDGVVSSPRPHFAFTVEINGGSMTVDFWGGVNQKEEIASNENDWVHCLHCLLLDIISVRDNDYYNWCHEFGYNIAYGVDSDGNITDEAEFEDEGHSYATFQMCMDMSKKWEENIDFDVEKMLELVEEYLD